jgi:hypothetical protein
LKLRKTASKMHRIITTVVSKLRGKQTSEWISILKCSDLQLKFVCAEAILPNVKRMEMWRQFAKSSTKIDEIPFWRFSFGEVYAIQGGNLRTPACFSLSQLSSY